MRTVSSPRGSMRMALLMLAMILSGATTSRAAEAEVPSGKAIKPVASIAGLPDAATSVAFDPAGKLVAVGSYDCVEVWDVPTRVKVRRIAVKSGFARSLTFSPDGSTLFVGGYQGITPVTAADWKVGTKWKGHRGYVTDLAVLPDGQGLVSCAEDMTVRVWSVADGSERQKLGKFTDPVTGVAVSPDGTLVVTTSGDETRLTRPGEIKVWNLATGEAVRTLAPHEKPPTEVAFSPDGKYLATTSFDERVNVYDVASGKALGYFGGHQRPTTCVAFLNDGQLVVSGCGGRFQGGAGLRVWTRDEGEVIDGVDFEKGKVTDLALSADGKSLAVALDTKQAILFEIDSAALKAPAPAAATTVGSVEAPRNTPPFADAASVGAPRESDPAVAARFLDSVADAGSIRNVVADAASVGAPREMDPAVAVRHLNSAADAGSIRNGAAVLLAQADTAEAAAEKPAETKELRIGIIGLDTSHSIAFTKVLNATSPKESVAGCRIVAAYPHGSRDIESSVSRIPEYTKTVEGLGVKIVGSIEELLPLVDCVLLETNDGRPHLEQALPVFKAGKRVFIDKPVAGSLVDCLAIYEAAKTHDVPVFSSSSLRFIEESLNARAGQYGAVSGCDAYSPCSLEATHPDLFWYGIHGCEVLFTVMGPGCETVTRASTKETDFVTGIWKDGRIGTFRGMRSGKSGYGGTAFAEKQNVPLGNFKGYDPLVVEIVKFFRTGVSPVSAEETIEIYAFMEAADESKRQGGMPVSVQEVLEKARGQVADRLKSLK